MLVAGSGMAPAALINSDPLVRKEKKGEPAPERAAAKPAAIQGKRKRRRADQRAHLGVALGIALLFATVMYYCIYTYGFENAKGLKFHRDVAWMGFFVSDLMVFAAPLLYVVAVMLFGRFSTSLAKPLWLKARVQPVYNVVQIVVCSYLVWGLWPQVDVLGGNPFGVNVKRNARIEWFVFVHYLTKFLDWCDTFFMILNKSYRQVSYLQVFHHATIGMIWGVLLSRGWGSGTVAYGAFINSVTHVLMYSHYFWTSLGFKNPLKRFLTLFQLSQFASCVLHALVVLVHETVVPRSLAWLQVTYHPIMLYLFMYKLNWAPLWLSGVKVVDTPKPKAKKQ